MLATSLGEGVTLLNDFTWVSQPAYGYCRDQRTRRLSHLEDGLSATFLYLSINLCVAALPRSVPIYNFQQSVGRAEASVFSRYVIILTC